MPSPRDPSADRRADRGGSRLDAARMAFVGTALIFVVIGSTTAVWISRTNMADKFVFGTTQLGSTMDPAGWYFQDVVLFFDPAPLQIVNHPGLSMTLTGAVVARVTYALLAEDDDYVDFWVRHRILLNGLLAGLASAMFLACCHPLFLVLRHVMDRSAAYVGCALFLGGVPVLLCISRFSDEPWMIYFTLWSIHLSLQALGGRGGLLNSVAMGASTALAVLSKWLVLPIVALNVYGLIRARALGAKRFWAHLAAFGVSLVAVAAALLSRVSIAQLVQGMQDNLSDPRGDYGVLWLWSLPHEQPFVLHNALVFLLGAVGLVVMFRAHPHHRVKLVALVGTVTLMASLTLRRPFWHYFFGFYWLFPAAAAYGLTLVAARWTSLRRDLAAVAAGLVVVATCNAWLYPGIVATFSGYRGYFEKRASLVRERPAWVPAPWEISSDGFEATQNPIGVYPFYSGSRLEEVLWRQREFEDLHAAPRSGERGSRRLAKDGKSWASEGP
jgi:hypothetical protein